jgi:hypothetical protein
LKSGYAQSGYAWSSRTSTRRRITFSFSAGDEPKTRTEPDDGNSWPARMRSKVVFPAPLRPEQSGNGLGADRQVHVIKGNLVGVFPGQPGYRDRRGRSDAPSRSL